MRSERQHPGFMEAAPEAVVWSEYSYLRPIQPDEPTFSLMPLKMIVLGGLGLIGLSILGFILWPSLMPRFPELQSLPWGYMGMGTMVLGILFLLFRGRVGRIVALSYCRKRSARLFDPDSDSLFVGLEKAATYDKSKVAPEDIGFLRIMPGYIQLEMARHRAQFAVQDIQASLLHTGKNLAGVRLSAVAGPYRWSVVLSVISSTGSMVRDAKAISKSQWLLARFQMVGIPTPQEQAAAGLFEAIPLDDDAPGDSSAGPLPVATPPGPPAEHADILENRYQETLAAIHKKTRRRKSWWKHAAILLISIYLFFQLQLLRQGVADVLMIIVVLLVHELGHFAGMKLFRYKNVQIFFLPLIGAAVSGVSQNVAGWKKALVILLGPGPGIVVGFILMVFYIGTHQEVYFRYGVMFVILNALNLLPIFPLDGGRFLQEVLFSRNRYLELIMNILATVVLLGAGFAMEDWILKILGFMNLLTLRFKFNVAQAAHRFRQTLRAQSGGEPEQILQSPGGSEDIPEPFLKDMLAWIYGHLPGPHRPATVATVVLDLWDRIRVRPPRLPATIGLILLFLGSYVLALATLGGLIVARSPVLNRIVSYTDDQGAPCHKEQVYLFGRLDSETQLTDDQKLYHGFYRAYYEDGALLEEGRWERGRRQGAWQSYDPNQTLIQEIIYEDGLPLLTKYLDQEEQWLETRWEDLDEEIQRFHREIAATPQGPGKKNAFSDKGDEGGLRWRRDDPPAQPQTSDNPAEASADKTGQGGRDGQQPHPSPIPHRE